MTLYIKEPPKEIPCWYCGQPCLPWDQSYPGFGKVEYICYHHDPLQVNVSCVKHNIPQEKTWFFNRIYVQHEHLRLHWNFYSGNHVHLEERRRTKDGGRENGWSFISIQKWPPKWQEYPADLIADNSAEKLLGFLKIYRNFS